MAGVVEKRLSESLEDYLEAILHVQDEKGAARPKDLARRLAVGPSAVTAALRNLADRELVNYAPYELVTLTDSGRALAEDVAGRHKALKQFFLRVLGVDEEVADTGACRMEHAVPREIIARFIQFVDFVELCPHGGPKFIEGFHYHVTQGCTREQCSHCPRGLAQADQDSEQGAKTQD
jgi:DtxR family Mn-dependent transcriptional regulator